MSALQRIALILIGTALLAALFIGGRSLDVRPDGSGDSASRAASPNEARPTSPPPGGAGKKTVGDAAHVRRIAPGSIAGPEIAGPLERIAPRAPLTVATKPLKRQFFGPPVPKGTLLYRPVASAAGLVEADGHDIRLAGVEPTPADRTCKDEGGRSWPCGTVARTAFRAWLRGRAIVCDVPSHSGEIVTRCTLDGEDMALWLVENGWAESAGSQYGDAETKARREKKGVFGPSPLEPE